MYNSSRDLKDRYTGCAVVEKGKKERELLTAFVPVSQFPPKTTKHQSHG